jgi:hypothetical protein
MAQILLTYDVKKTSDTIHHALKQYLIYHYQYSASILATDGNWYALPNTCLIKTGVTTVVASQEFQAACRVVGAHWEKYIVAESAVSNFNNQA